MAYKSTTHVSAIALGLGLTIIMADHAMATEGYFQHGWGARHSALAGAGVADGRDASAAALNPASLVKAGNSLQIAASLFSPHRKTTGTGQPGLAPLGTVESDTNFDGKADHWEHFDSSGKLTKREADRNFDGKPDLVENQ